MSFNCVLGQVNFSANGTCSFDDSNGPQGSFAVGNSHYGNWLPTQGTVKVLVLFIEVVYDVSGEIDPQSASVEWPAGQLPIWKDMLFDNVTNANPANGLVTDFFRRASFGSYNVLGDRLLNVDDNNKPIQVRKSKINSLGYTAAALEEIQIVFGSNPQLGKPFETFNGDPQNSFDNFTGTLASYVQKSLTPNQKFDHLMFIWRNGNIVPDYNGYTAPGSSSQLFGYQSDSYSIFKASSNLPLKILTHEFAHGLYGANDYHCGGGNSGARSYFFNMQGGWSTMGGANSSLLTFNGWDRYRLGWKPNANSDLIMAHDENGLQFVNADINPSTTSTNTFEFTLKDFSNTGDVVRIKLPFLPANEFQQWIWIENHQLKANNGFVLDKFFYEDEYSCIDNSTPGLYMFYQIERDDPTVFSGNADYIKAIDAEGFYDISLGTDSITNNCVNEEKFLSYKKILPNPFTGFKETEDIRTLNNTTQTAISSVLPAIEEINNGIFSKQLQYQGDSKDAFSLSHKSKIGIGSNPSFVNTLTDVNTSLSNEIHLDIDSIPKAPNNREIYLNGISLEIIDQLANGDIKIRVKLNDVEVNNTTRWAADNIILNPIASPSGNSLVLKPGSTISIDRSRSHNRYHVRKEFFYDPNSPSVKLCNLPTVLTVKPTAKIEMQAASNLIIENGSTLKLNNSAEINMLANAHIEVKSNGILDLEAGSLVKLAENATILVHDGGKIIIRDGATLQLQKNSQLLIEQDGVWGQGELVIENTQTDFGLILGDVNDGANTTECLINGKLTLGAGVDFTYKGSGFYTFGEYFNINFTDPLNRIYLNGINSNTLLIKNQCNEIDFTNHDVVITSGLIEYNSVGLMQLSNSLVHFEHLTLAGNFDAQVFNAKNLKSFGMINCYGTNFDRIGNISDAFPMSTMRVRYCSFEDCKYGFALDNIGDFTFDYVTMKRTKFTCISLNNTRIVNLLNSQLIENNLTNNAIEANDVIGLYMHGGIISESNTAILGTNTLVWLRMCATIEGNLIGIELYGNKIGSPLHYSSMLTIGDTRSANVRKNLTAIKGSDFLLNIEPVRYNAQHVIIYKSPNNFSENEMLFDICYTEPKLFNEINARYNYWGADLSGLPFDIDQTTYDIKEKTFCGNASNYHTPVNIITAPYSTCPPNNCSTNCTTYANGSFSPYIPRLFDAESYLDARALIESEFLYANTQFLELDAPSTRELFYYLSLIDLTKSEVSGKWVDPDDNEYDEKLVERVNTAKVLIQGLDQNSRRQPLNFKLKPNNKNLNIKTSKENTLSVFPNPAKDYLMVNYQTSKNEILTLEIINSLGQLVDKTSFKCESGINSKQINIENLPVGIYTIKFESNTYSVVKQFIKN